MVIASWNPDVNVFCEYLNYLVRTTENPCSRQHLSEAKFVGIDGV